MIICNCSFYFGVYTKQRAFVKRFIEISCQNELQKWHSTKNGCAFFVSKIPCPGSLCTRGLTGMVLGWQVDAAAVSCLLELRPVVPGGAGGAMAPPDFGRWVNPISTKWGRLCPPNNTSTLGFSDLPTALKVVLGVVHKLRLQEEWSR